MRSATHGERQPAIAKRDRMRCRAHDIVQAGRCRIAVSLYDQIRAYQIASGPHTASRIAADLEMPALRAVVWRQLAG